MVFRRIYILMSISDDMKMNELMKKNDNTPFQKYRPMIDRVKECFNRGKWLLRADNWMEMDWSAPNII